MTLLYVMLDNIDCFQFIYNDIPSNCNRNNIINCVESNKKKYPNLNSDTVSIFFSICKEKKTNSYFISYFNSYTHTHRHSQKILH